MRAQRELLEWWRDMTQDIPVCSCFENLFTLNHRVVAHMLALVFFFTPIIQLNGVVFFVILQGFAKNIDL